MHETRAGRFIETLPIATDRPIVAYGATLCFGLISLGIRVVASPLLPPGYPFVTFFPAVILSAFLFGLGPGILAAVLCAALSMVFIIPAAHGEIFTSGTFMAMLFYTLVVATDLILVHWMQVANARLRRERERSTMLAEKSDLLFRELQHRVSNNLQVVAALLTLQKRHIEDEQARAALDEASRRLALIGRIHRQLHDPSGGRIAMTSFLDQLGRDLIDAAGRPGISCTVDADESISINPDAAIPVALIVAESISNALEHGYAERDHGVITVRLLKAADGATELTVADDGKGLPDGFDIAHSTSLGLKIATTLARQLGGRFELVHGSGAIARLTLPA